MPEFELTTFVALLPSMEGGSEQPRKGKLGWSLASAIQICALRLIFPVNDLLSPSTTWNLHPQLVILPDDL